MVLHFQKKFEFPLKFLSCLFVLFVLIYSFILSLFLPTSEVAQLSYSERAANFFSFFTIQSNIMVFLFLFLSLFERKIKNRNLYYLVGLAVTTYITVTMGVFWVGLFSLKQIAGEYHGLNLFSTICLHLFVPLIMIANWIIFMNYKWYNSETHHAFACWWICSYLLFYFCIIMVRGVLRHSSSDVVDSWFPYLFLNFYKYSFAIMIIAIIMIMTFCILVQYLWIWVNNKIYLKLNNIKQMNSYEYLSKAYNKIPFSRNLQIGLLFTTLSALITNLVTIMFILLYFYNSGFHNNFYTDKITKNIYLIFVILILTINNIIITFTYYAYYQKKYWAFKILLFLQIISLGFNWLSIIGPILTIGSTYYLFKEELKKIHSLDFDYKISTQLNNI